MSFGWMTQPVPQWRSYEQADELLSVLADRLKLGGGVWDLASDVNLFGYVILGMFVLTWVTALCAWRFGRIEEHWSVGVPES